MSDSQNYIGCPNGIVLCVNSRAAGEWEGEFFYPYSALPVAFGNLGRAMMEMDRIFDILNYPRKGRRESNFLHNADASGKEMTRVMGDEELLEKRGDCGTFIIRVEHRQNCTWQGRATWKEKDETLYFRSALELIKLIDGALEEDSEASGAADVRFSPAPLG